MIKLKQILLIFVLQYSTTSSFLCDFFWHESCEEDFPFYIPTEASTTQSTTIGNLDYDFTGCPEGQSLISRTDLTIMIDYIANQITKVEESLVEGYYQKAVDMNSKYIEELNKYKEKIEDQPKHLEHILKNMEDERTRLEPAVKQIASEIEESDAHEEQSLSVLNNRLQNYLTAMNAYDTLCQINTGNQKLAKRLKHRQNIPLNGVGHPSKICGHLKDFHNEITKQLINFRDEYIEELLTFIEDKDNNYSSSVASHNKELKNLAMRQHKGVMYDILKLQDDLIHFKEHLDEYSITQTLNDTKNNLERIGQLLDGLEVDVHKYGQRCVESNHKKDRDESVTPVLLKANTKRGPKNLKIIDELTQIKIEEIKTEVLRNLTDTFKSLDEQLNSPIISTDSLDDTTNTEDLADIKKAQEALIELKSIIPQSSLEKIQNLRQNSEEILAQTEKARENLDLKLKGKDLLARK